MSRRGWLLFAGMCLMWGVPYLMIKVAVHEVSVPVLVFARTAIGAVVLLPLAMRPGTLALLRRHWLPVLGFAGLEIIGPWWLLSDAERHITSSMTGLLIAAVPIIAVVLARLFGDTERLRPARLAGLLIGLAGVALLALPHLGGGTGWAVLEMFGVAVGYAAAPLIASRWLTEVSDVQLTAASLSLAALVYLVPAVLTWPAAIPSGPVLASLAGLGLVCTALAFVVFFALIREVGTTRAVVFTYVNPAVAVTAGVLVLGEPLNPTILGAFGLILLGSVLATGRRVTPQPAPPVERVRS